MLSVSLCHVTGGVQNAPFLLRGLIMAFKAKVGGSGVDVGLKMSHVSCVWSRLGWFVLVPGQRSALSSVSGFALSRFPDVISADGRICILKRVNYDDVICICSL